jgi:PTS system mannose-specific IIA component
MIGILLITHGLLGRELLLSAEFILGAIEAVETLAVEANADTDSLRKELKKAIDRLGGKNGKVLILTDMFGGTPNNVSLVFLGKNRVEVVTGVNLPMLIKAATSRKNHDLPELARLVCQAGRDAISVAGELISA